MARTNQHNSLGLAAEQATDLPDSWEDLDVDCPDDLCRRISPYDLQKATEQCSTIFGITKEVGGSRRGIRRALNKLGLHDRLQEGSPNPHELATNHNQATA